MSVFKALAVTALFFSLAGNSAAQSSVDPVAVEKRITNTLHQMYEAEKHGDLSFVLTRLSDDFAEVAGDGNVYSRGDIEKGWPDVKLNDYKLSDCVFKLMTPNAAYMACKMDVNATYKGQPIPNRMRVATVWTRKNGAWLIRFEQATPISEGQKAEVGLQPKSAGCSAQ